MLTNNKQQELLQSQITAKETSNSESNSEKLIERVPLIGTPFTSTKHHDEYHLVMGKYRLNERPLANHEEVIDYANEEEYNIILKMIMIVVNDLIEEGKRQKDTNKALPVDQY